MLKGLLAAGITMGVAAVFPQALVFPIYAAVLGLVVGILPGLAMADKEAGRPGVQWVAAILLLGLGLLGLWISPLLLAGAWVLQGLWALLHRVTALGDGVPEGYPGFCAAYGFVTASFVAYMWAAGVLG